MERILYVTGQDKEKQKHSETSPSMIFVTDKRIIIKNDTSIGMKDLIQDMHMIILVQLKLQEGLGSSRIVFNGARFAEVNTMSQESLQRAWGIEEETILDSMPKKDAKEFVNILKEQLEKNGIKN